MSRIIAAINSPISIHSFRSRFFPAQEFAFIAGGLSAAGAAAWPSANAAFYIPFRINFTYPIARVFWANNNTAAGHVDVGIYTVNGNKLASTGSVVMTGTTVIQYANLSLTLSPGNYYLGIASDGGGTFFAVGNSTLERIIGKLEQASAFPLPSTMTPAVTTHNFYPFVGLTRFASGF